MNKEEIDKFARHMIKIGQADAYIKTTLITWAIGIPVGILIVLGYIFW